MHKKSVTPSIRMSEEDAKRKAIDLATAMARVGVELSFKVEEI